MDWGWYPDPFAFNKVHFDAARRELYIFAEYTVNKESNRKTFDALYNDKFLYSDEFIKQCEEVILSRFDHAFIYDSSSAGESEIAAVVVKNGMRAVAIPFRSTAENLARHFFGELKARIPGLCRVRVWETPDSCAEYAE